MHQKFPLVALFVLAYFWPNFQLLTRSRPSAHVASSGCCSSAASKRVRWPSPSAGGACVTRSLNSSGHPCPLAWSGRWQAASEAVEKLHVSVSDEVTFPFGARRQMRRSGAAVGLQTTL